MKISVALIALAVVAFTLGLATGSRTGTTFNGASLIGVLLIATAIFLTIRNSPKEQ